MQTLQSFGVHFTTRPDKTKDGKEPVYACVTVNRKRVYLALKLAVDPNNWDSRKGLAKGNKEEVKEINAYLGEVRVTLGNHYRELQVKGKLITAQVIKSLFLGEKEEVYTLTRLIKYHEETASASLKWSTLKHYNVTRRYLEKFLKEKHNSTDIYLHQLDFKFVKDFEVYLRNHQPKDHQKPLNNNGVMKHIIRLRKMINLALNLGWMDQEPFAGYKLRMQRVNREFLSATELETIEQKEFAVERLELVRDLFVFSCYTGLAYVEVANLLPHNIIRERDGKYWIRTVREKTLIPVNVPLLPRAMAIYLKYKNHIRARDQGKAFPIISNQKVNSYLKEVADRCDIFKKITFHIARHTFATTVALSNGVPMETVSKLLGHTKIATTQIYAKVLEKKISEDMDALSLRISQPVKRKAARKPLSR
jgi:site-specific recombinase XerD